MFPNDVRWLKVLAEEVLSELSDKFLAFLAFFALDSGAGSNAS